MRFIAIMLKYYSKFFIEFLDHQNPGWGNFICSSVFTQVFISENGIKFVRIDGSTLQRERKEAVDSFRLDPEVLPPTPPTHPPTLLLYFPHFSYSICLITPKIGLMFIHFILFIFKKGEGCNNWNYCWRCWFRLLVCSECYFCGAPKNSFRIASGP